MSETIPSNRVKLPDTPPSGEGINGSRQMEPAQAASLPREESAAALWESEEQFRAFFELAAMGATQADMETGRFIRVNDRYCEITGYSRAELLSTTFVNLTHPDDRRADWEKFQRMVRGETREYDIEKRYFCKDGKLIWVHVTAAAVRDARGKPLRSVALIHDITERKRAEAALRLSEERFRAQYENSPIPTFTYQAGKEGEFVLVECNDAARTLTQDHVAELIGWTAGEVFPDQPAILADMSRCFREKNPIHHELQHRLRTTGESKHFALTYVFVPPDLVMLHAEDITERKLAEAALQKSKLALEHMLENIGTPFFSLDHEWRYTYLNRSILAYGEKQPVNLLGSVIWERSPYLLGSNLEAAFRKAVSEQTVVDVDYYWSVGKRWFHNRAFPTPEGLSVFSFDITERKSAEIALQCAMDQLGQTNEKLEKRVRERTASLEESLKSLEGVLYHVAHDLRGPLRAMHSFTDLLLEDYAPSLDATGEEYAQIISEATTKMDFLIRDLLDYGRLGHQNVAWTAIDLKALLERLLAGLREEVRIKGAEIQVAGPLPTVLGDPQILEQVLVNLISNSLKFVDRGTAPRLRIWAEADADTVRLNVQDNGIGIEQKYQERIFWVFERLHTESAYPGTGIGLAMVKKGMERLRGRVGLESKPGEGSRFWLELKAGHPSL
jgi:PAS domain S-box-containing protein